ncbi:MAG: 4-hydroxybenzoate octaprenyltransferase [Pseudomonadota bacterium]
MTRPADPLTTPDAAPANWVEQSAPQAAKPYLRLMRADRPAGTWLLLIPCLWGAGLALAMGSDASAWSQAAWHGVLFAIGAFVMRGAGCAYNDIVDRDFDAQVTRTALRPIPSGQISVRHAWIFLIGLSLVGFLVLVQFNRTTIGVGLASLALVAAYPFMKRITWWPQAWLGITFNWGALVGFAAATGGLDVSALLIYAAGIFWTLGYDTIYAWQDIEDDALIGVKSSARRLGDRTRPALYGFYGATLGLFAMAGLACGASALFFIALAAPAAHFLWQIRAFRPNDPPLALKLFKSNRDAGLLLLATLLLEAARAGA